MKTYRILKKPFVIKKGDQFMKPTYFGWVPYDSWMIGKRESDFRAWIYRRPIRSKKFKS